MILLAGYQSASDVQQEQEQRMGAVIGMTMAEFSGATGLMPSNAYDVDGGRIFVVLGRTVTLAIPSNYSAPAVANTTTGLRR